MHQPQLNYPPPRASCTVLVVDTNLTLVHSYAQALRSAGYVVFEATSFDEGKRFWRENKPTVLVADVRLGQYNGLQLVIRARGERPDIKAIVTCPVADQVLEAESRRCGAMFLLKPLAPAQIVGAVSAAMAMGQPARAPLLPLVERRSKDRRQQDSPFAWPDRRVTLDRRQADHRTRRQ